MPIQRVRKSPQIASSHHHEMLQMQDQGYQNYGNWSDADTLIGDKRGKEPLNHLDSFIYTMDCTIGTPKVEGEESILVQQCLLDTSTPISSTFNKESFGKGWDKSDS